MALKLTIIVMIMIIVNGFSGAENQTSSDREDMNETCTDFPPELSTDGAANREVCEITNLKDVVAPSAQGDIYPLNTGNASYFLRFDDSSMFSISLTNNCSRLRIEIMNILAFHLVSASTIQDILNYCPNGTFILKLFCDPSVIYNVTLVTEPSISYFSGIDLYFTDEFYYCTKWFNDFILRHNRKINNDDASFFLTNVTSCWEKMSLINQQNIVFTLLKANIDKRKQLLPAFMAMWKYNYFTYKFMFLYSKQEYCIDQFTRFIHHSGYKLSDDEYSMIGLSVHTILEYIDNTICLKMQYKCRKDTYYVSEEFIQGEHISNLMMALAAGITVVNLFVISIFLKNENRSATTVLLSCLAVSDTFTALLRSLPYFIVYQLFYDYIGFIRHTPRLYLIGYSFSILFSLAIEMSNGFHLLSVFITTLLCMQKAVALLFPLWSSSHLDKASSLKGFCLVLILTLLLYLPISYFQIYTYNDVNGSCCKDQMKLIDIFDFYRYLYLTSNIITLCALSVVLACSVYITCKLTCIRKYLPWTDNFAVRRRNIQSAITVLLISVIFILSESMYMLSIIIYVQWDSDFEPLSELYFDVRQYSDISLLIGFSLNFVVYLVMSEQLRKRISIGARGILERIKCC